MKKLLCVIAVGLSVSCMIGKSGDTKAPHSTTGYVKQEKTGGTTDVKADGTVNNKSNVGTEQTCPEGQKFDSTQNKCVAN